MIAAEPGPNRRFLDGVGVVRSLFVLGELPRLSGHNLEVVNDG